ncbi:MAG: hypothetical protein JXB62_07520 [Pirellulales bacterium]|nr:hypothetical protein [Pirellulales bacterium]
MGLARGVVGGVIAGLIGAAVWAGISYGTGYEIGWIAWGIGLLVGLGVALGGEEGPLSGLLAVIISVLAILGGKYAAVELVLNREMGDPSQAIEQALAQLDSDEFTISFLADGVIAAREAQGESIAWPPGVNPITAEKESDYPAEIWAQARSQWNDKSREDRETYRAEVGEALRKNIEENFGQLRSHISRQGFLSSFGLMDIIFIVLAIVTAFKVAVGKQASTPQAPTEA